VKGAPTSLPGLTTIASKPSSSDFLRRKFWRVEYF
jgi:hypothetical protein